MLRAWVIFGGVLLLAASATLGVVLLPPATRPAASTAGRDATGLAATATDTAAVRFAAVDVFLDSHDQRLAAYQLDVTVAKGQATIVGVEGGEAAAFRGAPYYDPAALQHGRIIIAAFSTADALPTGKTRVARLHMEITGDVTPEYVTTLKVATDPAGKEIAAQATMTDARP